MATPLALIFDLIATDNASAVFKRVGAEAGATGAATESLGSKFSKMGGAIALAAVGVAVVSTKMAADFQEATTLLVTGAGESEKSIKLVRDGLLAMAPAVGIGPTALAKAMFMVESAGYHGAAGLTVMKAAAEGAKIGGADATVVANGLTTALTDYHLPASKAAEVTSKLVATVSAGKTNMADLTASLSGILPFASSLGVKFNDITGAMATMTGEGIDAANASTMLRFTMMSLANETPKGQKALKSIGMTAQELKNDLSTKGVGGALSVVTEQISKHFPAGSVKATAALAAIAGGTRGMGAALALTGTHAATLTANIKSIANASTEAGGHVKGWALTSEDLKVQMSQLTAFVQTLAVKIGTVLIPVIEEIITWMGKHKVAVEVLAGVIGTVLAAAAVVWVASTVAMIASAVATGVAAMASGLVIAAGWLLALGPIGLVAIAVIGLGVLIATHMDQIKGFISGAWDWVKEKTSAAWNWIKDTTATVWNAIKGNLKTIVEALVVVITGPVGLVGVYIFNNWEKVKSITSAAWDSVKSTTSSAWNGIVSFFTGIPGKILGALGDLGSLLVNAGASIMSGLFNGIKSGFEAVKNFVGGIGSWISSHKGPLEYDRQLLVPHGGAMMAGLNEGLTTGFGKVQGNVGSMAGRLSIGSLDFASSSVHSNAVNGLSSRGATLDDLIAVVRALPRDYQTIQRKGM